jgi:hypothetical protein
MGMIFSAPLQPDAAKLHILSHEAQLGELHRGHEPQEFLDGKLTTLLAFVISHRRPIRASQRSRQSAATEIEE